MKSINIVVVLFMLIGCAALAFVAGLAIFGLTAGWSIDGNLVVTGTTFMRVGGPLIGTFGLAFFAFAYIIYRSQNVREPVDQPLLVDQLHDHAPEPEPEPEPKLVSELLPRPGSSRFKRQSELLDQLP